MPKKHKKKKEDRQLNGDNFDDSNRETEMTQPSDSYERTNTIKAIAQPLDETTPVSDKSKDNLSKRRKGDVTEEEPSKPFSPYITLQYQKSISEKLSKALDRVKTVEDVQVAQDNCRNSLDTAVPDDDGIFLFSTSNVRTSTRDLQLQAQESSKPRKKPNLRVKRHIDGSESEDEDEKIRAVAVSADWVMSNNYS